MILNHRNNILHISIQFFVIPRMRQFGFSEIFTSNYVVQTEINEKNAKKHMCAQFSRHVNINNKMQCTSRGV